jgi:LAO/AO transport system kinase
MATRGSLGGLASKTQLVCDLLDAFGKDLIMIETVGVGQAELDVARATHTTVVVLVPESGNGIQAMKAGLMEIADIFVVNKSDREGADRLALEIDMILKMKAEDEDWQPPIIRTIASTGEGIDQLTQKISTHYKYLEENELIDIFRQNRVRWEIREQLEQRFHRALWDNPKFLSLVEDVVTQVMDGKSSPGVATEKISNEGNKQS